MYGLPKYLVNWVFNEYSEFSFKYALIFMEIQNSDRRIVCCTVVSVPILNTLKLTFAS